MTASLLAAEPTTLDAVAAAAPDAAKLDVADLYRTSMLADALRDAARSLLTARHPNFGGTAATMAHRFNRLRESYLAIVTGSAADATVSWVPEPLPTGVGIAEIFDSAAALAALLDVTVHSPAVVASHKLAATKIAAAERELGAAGPVPTPVRTAPEVPGAYL